jgi:formylglycine-generating enzyme required for sulfatase activity
MKTGCFAMLGLVFALSACAPPVKPIIGQPWTNSLGVKFVPAGTDGVLFSVWDVRVKDFSAYVKETGNDSASKFLLPHGDMDEPSFKTRNEENVPKVNVSWNNAHAFCDWLTKKEQGEGWLASNQKYRLPTDAEWSKAVGLNESTEGSPKDKDDKITGVYPWGMQWPPPRGAGNYAGEETESKYHIVPGWTFIKGYDDGYVEMSPVGSFPPNRYGLSDMSGNVWQWCEDGYLPHSDTYRPGSDDRVSRGGSWRDADPQCLLSSARGHCDFDFSTSSLGFRIVVVVSP